MGMTVDQVDRQALSKSGNSFDHTRCIVTISESEKTTL
jgi:hypothetical protein